MNIGLQYFNKYYICIYKHCGNLKETQPQFHKVIISIYSPSEKGKPVEFNQLPPAMKFPGANS